MSSVLPAPVALVTGVGRRIGIANAITETLRSDGWKVVTVGWRAYDDRMPWRSDPVALADIEADFADAAVPGAVMTRANREHGPIQALVMCHAESVDSGIRDTTIESFDRHFAVNARSTWLLIKAYAEQYASPFGSGRVIAITSDSTEFNLPYGASKAALDRIVLDVPDELSDLGLTANVINPGATDTGWMSDQIKSSVLERNLSPRIGIPQDCANLVRFLLSPEGGWMNKQLLYSDGGVRR